MEPPTGAAENKSDWDDWVAGQCSWGPSGATTIPLMVQVGTPASIAKSSSPTAQEQFDLTKMAMGGEESRGWATPRSTVPAFCSSAGAALS